MPTSPSEFLSTVRQALLDYVQRSLMDHSGPRQMPAHVVWLPTAFDSDDWRRSALFRRPAPTLTDWRRQAGAVDALRRHVWDFRHNPDLDEAAHAERESLGALWASMRLLSLGADLEFMRALTLATAAHWTTHYRLRLKVPLRESDRLTTGLDLRRGGTGPRWALGPFSPHCLYAAYLLDLARQEAGLARLAERLTVSLIDADRPSWLESTRLRLLAAATRLLAYIETEAERFTLGDLLLLDALVLNLLRPPALAWIDLRPLLRLSALTRIVQGPALERLGHMPATFLLHARSGSSRQTRPELACLAEDGASAGVFHMVIQALAEAASPRVAPLVFAEAADVLREITLPAYHRLLPPQGKPTEADYWTGVFLLRVYSLAHRDGTLPFAIQRSPDDYAGALRPSGFLLLLNQRDGRTLVQPSGHPGRVAWRQSRSTLQNLVEIYGH
jgi:hypothetical protein